MAAVVDTRSSVGEGNRVLPMGAIELVLMDWAGTVTVPMSQMVRDAVDHLEWSDDELARALTGLADYFTSDDSMVHRAERGQIDDRELLAWLDEQHPGASALFDVDRPSFINAADRPEMIELLWWLQDHEFEVWLATNNFASAQDMLAGRYLDSGLVNAIVNSALIGARKPDAAFWEIVIEASGLTADELLLVDDNLANLEAAAELGMATLFIGDDAAPAIADLKTRFGPTS
jgi:putative hydrolase of the HAD superfamily